MRGASAAARELDEAASLLKMFKPLQDESSYRGRVESSRIDESVDRQNAIDVSIVESHEHHPVVVLGFDDVPDGAPFKSAPLLRRILP